MNFDDIIDKNTGMFRDGELEEALLSMKIPEYPKRDDGVAFLTEENGARIFVDKNGRIIRK